MKFCSNCGNQIDETATICPNCHKILQQDTTANVCTHAKIKKRYGLLSILLGFEGLFVLGAAIIALISVIVNMRLDLRDVGVIFVLLLISAPGFLIPFFFIKKKTPKDELLTTMLHLFVRSFLLLPCLVAAMATLIFFVFGLFVGGSIMHWVGTPGASDYTAFVDGKMISVRKYDDKTFVDSEENFYIA